MSPQNDKCPDKKRQSGLFGTDQGRDWQDVATAGGPQESPKAGRGKGNLPRPVTGSVVLPAS